MNKIFIIGAAFTALCLAGCDNQPSSDDVQRLGQEALSRQGNAMVGMPGITNFFEKKQFKRILEMRDNPHLITYTYTRDINGKLHTVCHSIGFPIPGATQYTNPQRPSWLYNYGHGEALVVPQADPNGLFSPPSEDATWVLCQNPKNPKDIEPTYQENKVETFLWEMPVVD